jgi:hypothetical protein
VATVLHPPPVLRTSPVLSCVAQLAAVLVALIVSSAINPFTGFVSNLLAGFLLGVVLFVLFFVFLRRRTRRRSRRLPANVPWSVDGRRWWDGTLWRRPVSRKRAYWLPALTGTVGSAATVFLIVATLVTPDVLSRNWTGWVASGYSFQVVQGTWTQPALSCPKAGISAVTIWVGIDGKTSNSVEQIGTAAECRNGSPVYAAWYEMAPAPLLAVNVSQFAATPGHRFTGRVEALGRDFTLTLMDSTSGQRFVTHQSTSAVTAHSSAEWVVEPLCVSPVRSPSVSCHSDSLAHFAPIEFSACSAMATVNGASVSRALDGWSTAPQIATDPTYGILAHPSALTDGGFVVTWRHQ